MNALVSLVRWLARPAERRPISQRYPRWTVNIASLLIGIGVLLAVFVASGSTAHALGCADADQKLPTVTGTAYRAHASYGSGTSDGYVIVIDVTNAGYDAGNGLRFDTFAFSGCGDTGEKVTNSVATMLWSAILLPVQWVGSAIDWGLGGQVAGALLDQVGNLTAALKGTFFTEWAPVVILLSLLAVILAVARRRKQGWSQVAWMVVVIAGVSIVASPVGTDLARNTNEYAAGIARCAAMVPNGGCSGGNLSSRMVDSLTGQTWARGVLGDLGNEPAPTELQWHEDDVPDVNQSRSITVPVDAIPAATPGQPTWAEVWRWSGAYTLAESAYLASSHHQDAQCTVTKPTAGDVTSTEASEALDPAQVCSLKYRVRVALLSTLHETNAEAYDVARGATTLGTDSAWSLLSLLPGLAILAFLALMAIVAEVRFLFYVVLTPIAGLAALREAQVAKDWGQKLVASFVQRIVAGLTVGLGVFMLSMIIGLVNGVDGGDAPVPTALRPVVIGILAIAAGIAAIKLKSELSDLGTKMTGNQEIAAAAQAETAVFQKAGGVVKGAAGAAAGAFAGGAMAGQGNRVKGMLRGSARGALSRGPAAGLLLGGEAGQRVRDEQERREERRELLASKAAVPAFTEDPRQPAHQGVRAAERTLMQAPEVIAEQARAVGAAGELADAARELAAAARAEREALEQRLQDQVTAGTLTPEAAEVRLAPVREQEQVATVNLARAEAELGRAQTELPELAAELAAALRDGAEPDRLADQVGASQMLRDGLHEYAQAFQAWEAVTYPAEGG